MSTGNLVSVEVPDIGDFEDVPIIEILVSPGDQVALDDPLITLESDKATMDVPAPFAGVIRDLHVQIGDRVSQGSRLLDIEPSANSASPAPSKASAVASDGAPNESSAPVIRSRSAMHFAARIVGSCARQAPFGLPVVPDV